jgi:hypothetical protein
MKRVTLTKGVYMAKYYLENPITAEKVSITLGLFTLLVLMIVPSSACNLDKHDLHVSLPNWLAHIKFEGADGQKCSNSVIVENAKNTEEGVAAEKVWISKCYPDAHVKAKAISQNDGKIYEVVEIETHDSVIKQICFDVTKFFGSW